MSSACSQSSRARRRLPAAWRVSPRWVRTSAPSPVKSSRPPEDDQSTAACMGLRGEFGHRVAVVVGYPEVGAVHGDRGGAVESVAWSLQHGERGAGGGVDLGHRAAATVGDPEVGAVHGDRGGAVESVAWSLQHGERGAGGGVDLGHRAVKLAAVVDYPEVGAIRGGDGGAVESVAWSLELLDQGPGGSVDLDHKVVVVAGHPEVGAAHGEAGEGVGGDPIARFWEFGHKDT